MKSIWLIANRQKDPDLSATRRVAQTLRRYGMTPYVDASFRNDLAEAAVYYPTGERPEGAELILVLGGDGSVLRAAEQAQRYDLPVLGINLGRLGYLNELEMDRLEALQLLSAGEYSIKIRMTLQVSLSRGGKVETLPFSPLNDVVIAACGHLADIRMYQGDSCTLDYRADGIIVASPSGSTAYTLSAGGPVIDDGLQALCVTPICPRSFFARSLLFGSEQVLRLENISQRGVELEVTADGKSCGVLRQGESVTVSKAPVGLRMLTLYPRTTLQVVQRKMKMQNF